MINKIALLYCKNSIYIKLLLNIINYDWHSRTDHLKYSKIPVPWYLFSITSFQIPLLAESDLATFDLHGNHGKSLLQGPRVHDGLHIQLVLHEPFLLTEDINISLARSITRYITNMTVSQMRYNLGTIYWVSHRGGRSTLFNILSKATWFCIWFCLIICLALPPHPMVGIPHSDKDFSVGFHVILQIRPSMRILWLHWYDL